MGDLRLSGKRFPQALFVHMAAWIATGVNVMIGGRSPSPMADLHLLRAGESGTITCPGGQRGSGGFLGPRRCTPHRNHVPFSTGKRRVLGPREESELRLGCGASPRRLVSSGLDAPRLGGGPERPVQTCDRRGPKTVRPPQVAAGGAHRLAPRGRQRRRPTSRWPNPSTRH